ncbi:reverse transcriptase domain-containing protein [Tanacetum coccineum]|uniref:Reverse transcriptase domain-containing protein n=1 Tax=Tanacetum coccineum TaxID=301880 RepID=A0ABQ4YNY8_9ASTR
MPPTMMTRSDGRPAAALLGGGTGGRAGSGDGRTRGRSVPDFSTIIAHKLQNLLPTILAQVGQGNGRNQNGNAINDNVQGDVSRGCTYKVVLACNPKEYDGKGSAIVYTRWIEKMGSVQDMSGYRDNQKGDVNTEEFCPSNEMQKLETELWNHVMVRAGHATYTDRFHELARNGGNNRAKTIQKAVQIAGTLTDEALRNGSIKKNPKKRGYGGEPRKDRNVREDNKRTRTGNAFVTIANPVRGGYTSIAPKCTTCSYHHSLETPCHSCSNCNHLGHFAKDCRVASRNVNPVSDRNPVARTCFECGSTDHIKSACPRLNQAQTLGGNHQNQVMTYNGGQGRGNQRNQARGRAFLLGTKEARLD